MIHTGIDLVSISRISGVLSRGETSFFSKICRESEVSLLENTKTGERRVQKVAAIFALKEAFSKAAGMGIGRMLSFHDIEISYSLEGQPKLRYCGTQWPMLSKKSDSISCSVSHEGDHLIAIVVVEGEFQ